MFQPSAFEGLLPSKPLLPEEPDEIGRVLLEAAHAIRTRGHLKHSFGSANDGFCIVGAISQASPVSMLGSEIIIPFSRHAAVARVMASTGYNNMVVWNDHPSTTPAEVIAALEAAAFHRDPVSA